jgi:hypothetical protein
MQDPLAKCPLWRVLPDKAVSKTLIQFPYYTSVSLLCLHLLPQQDIADHEASGFDDGHQKFKGANLLFLSKARANEYHDVIEARNVTLQVRGILPLKKG